MAAQTTTYRHSVDHSQQEGEKYPMERTSVSSDAPLKDDQDDLEAQTVVQAQQPPAQPLEYSTSTTKKLVFLGLYFFLSLGLTLSNKALMKKVGLQRVCATCGGFRRLTKCEVQTALASDSATHRIHLHWNLHVPCHRKPQVVEIRDKGEPHLGCIFHTLHPQYRD